MNPLVDRDIFVDKERKRVMELHNRKLAAIKKSDGHYRLKHIQSTETKMKLRHGMMGRSIQFQEDQKERQINHENYVLLQKLVNIVQGRYLSVHVDKSSVAPTPYIAGGFTHKKQSSTMMSNERRSPSPERRRRQRVVLRNELSHLTSSQGSPPLVVQTDYPYNLVLEERKVPAPKTKSVQKAEIHRQNERFAKKLAEIKASIPARRQMQRDYQKHVQTKNLRSRLVVSKSKLPAVHHSLHIQRADFHEELQFRAQEEGDSSFMQLGGLSTQLEASNPSLDPALLGQFNNTESLNRETQDLLLRINAESTKDLQTSMEILKSNKHLSSGLPQLVSSTDFTAKESHPELSTGKYTESKQKHLNIPSNMSSSHNFTPNATESKNQLTQSSKLLNPMELEEKETVDEEVRLILDKLMENQKKVLQHSSSQEHKVGKRDLTLEEIGKAFLPQIDQRTRTINEVAPETLNPYAGQSTADNTRSNPGSSRTRPYNPYTNATPKSKKSKAKSSRNSKITGQVQGSGSTAQSGATWQSKGGREMQSPVLPSIIERNEERLRDSSIIEQMPKPSGKSQMSLNTKPDLSSKKHQLSSNKSLRYSQSIDRGVIEQLPMSTPGANSSKKKAPSPDSMAKMKGSEQLHILDENHTSFESVREGLTTTGVQMSRKKRGLIDVSLPISSQIGDEMIQLPLNESFEQPPSQIEQIEEVLPKKKSTAMNKRYPSNTNIRKVQPHQLVKKVVGPKGVARPRLSQKIEETLGEEEAVSEATQKNNVMVNSSIRHVRDTMIRKEYYGDDDELYHSSRSNEEEKVTNSLLSRKRSMVGKQSKARKVSGQPSYHDNDYSSYQSSKMKQKIQELSAKSLNLSQANQTNFKKLNSIYMQAPPVIPDINTRPDNQRRVKHSWQAKSTSLSTNRGRNIRHLLTQLQPSKLTSDKIDLKNVLAGGRTEQGQLTSSSHQSPVTSKTRGQAYAVKPQRKSLAPSDSKFIQTEATRRGEESAPVAPYLVPRRSKIRIKESLRKSISGEESTLKGDD